MHGQITRQSHHGRASEAFAVYRDNIEPLPEREIVRGIEAAP